MNAKDDPNQMLQVSGIMQTLVCFFKTGHRDDLLSRIQQIYDIILQGEIKNKFMAKSTIMRKNKVKLAQRLG